MSNRVHIIAHPEAGSGYGAQVTQKVMKILDGFHMEYLIYTTNYATHANLLTQQLLHPRSSRDVEHILVIGGDGTLHEVVGSLQEDELDIPITYIPAGTGNDFQKAWYPEADERDIIEGMLFHREPRYVPIFRYEENFTGQKGVIVTSYGFGFDAMINAQAKRNLSRTLRPFRDKFREWNVPYYHALLQSLFDIPHFPVEFSMDGHTYRIANSSIALIMNSPYIAGTVRMDQQTAPEAEEISLVVYHNLDRRGMFDVGKRLIRQRDYEQSPNISRFSGQRLRLVIPEPVVSQIDGENRPANPVDLSVRLSRQGFYFPWK